MAEHAPGVSQTVYADYWRKVPLKVVRIEGNCAITVPLDTDIRKTPVRHLFDENGDQPWAR